MPNQSKTLVEVLHKLWGVLDQTQRKTRSQTLKALLESGKQEITLLKAIVGLE